jgi:hypothetical protein
LSPPIINHFNFTLLTDDNTHCPGCLGTLFKEDHTRAEKYCQKCGLVLEAPYDYVGGNKIIIPFSYNYYIQQNFETNPIENWGGYSRKSY